MECKHCGRAFEQDHNFCSHCGGKIENEAPKEGVVTEPVTEEAKEDDKPIPKKKSITKVQFSTLLFSIMFIFSVLAISMVLQVDQEVHLMQHEIDSLHQKIAKDKAGHFEEKKARITGEDVQISHIGHFSHGEIHAMMLNIQVPDGVFFNGVAVDELSQAAKKAFARELIQTNWSQIRAEVYECYPNLEVQLLVNDQPYALYDGKAIKLYQ